MACNRVRKTNNLDQLFEAVYESDEGTAAELLKSSPNIRNTNGLTLIDQAVLHSSMDKLRQFISVGCDLNLLTDGQTPLFTAIKLCKFEVAEILLEARADVNKKSTCAVSDEIKDTEQDGDESRYSLSPLYLAVRCNHVNIVELLIRYGSKIDEPSLLHGAIRTGNPELLKILLNAGAFVDQEDHKNWTPLATAITREEPGMIRLLLDHGADPCKPIPFLVFQNCNKIFFTPLLLSTIFDTTLIPELLALGADPCVGCVPHGTAQRMDLKWCMAPICSSLGRNCKSLKYFLIANCPLVWQSGDHAPLKDADAENAFHQHDSALYMALFKRGRDSVELLLKCGFDISSCGAPTKQLAKKMLSDNKHKEIGKLLKTPLEIPLTLLSLCRNVIRQNIGSGITEKVQSLMLPPAIINYVLLKDVLSM